MAMNSAVKTIFAKAARSSGVLVDCGSCHTGVIFYSYDSGTGVHQHAKASIKHADGGNLPLTDFFLPTATPEKFAEFIEKLKHVLARQYVVDSILPEILYVGATGGVRKAIESGRIESIQVEAFRGALSAAFSGDSGMRVVKFEVLTGSQEASWELDAAQTIWGRSFSKLFPVNTNAADAPQMKSLSSAAVIERTNRSIGLFSGGGQSMQLGRIGFDPLSFPFATFNLEFEEREGAASDAWTVPAKWRRFEQNMTAKIVAEAAKHNALDGCFVCTAMNHRASMYSEFEEIPISVEAAVKKLNAALPQFLERSGPLYEKMMATGTPGSPYPLARITAMHTYRLATVLQHMFSPTAQLYFARNGIDSVTGESIECEWTLGAFMSETRANE